MATIKDIAKDCGLSSATVSYVLSGKGNERRIPLHTQDMVLNSADKLGYKRSTPRAHNHIQIAFYWQDAGFELASINIFQAINHVISLEHLDINIIIRPYTVGHLCDDEYLFSNNYYDGVVLTGINADDIEYLLKNKPKIPVVVVNREIEGFSSVSIDNEETGRIAALHAIQNGKNDIAVVFNPSSFTCMTLRGKSFLKTCEEHGIYLPDSIYYCSNKIDSGYDIAQKMIAKNSIKKVIFCNHDVVALGIMNAFNESGIAIGNDVQIFAASNGPSRLMARSTPPLTVIDLKMEETAERSLRMIIDIVTGRMSGIQRQVIYPSIIYRQSSPVQNLL
ncbi:substrate-binding domain-containing protein [Clostridioides difficile]|nr:substrate-binding domain-containing protein [Clostridioides difficile]